MKTFTDIIVLKNGWIFLLGGSNDVRHYWINKNNVEEKVLAKWLQVYKKRIAFFKQNNIRYISTFAPEKLSIYKDKVPFEISDAYIPSLQLFEYLREHLREDESDVFVDLIPYLRSQSESFLTYHKTDSHWNFFGAYSAYQLIQYRLGEPMYADALQRPRNYNWTVLDLGGKLDPPLKEKVFFYQSSGRFKRIYANELVKYKETNKKENDVGYHVGSYVIYENEDYLSDKTVMIFGDSFSEYRDHLLTGLFAETYKQVHFIWNASLDFNLIEKVKPDIVISELAERFIMKAPVVK